MGIKLVVAVTDSDWFEMLRWNPSLSEVNFWSPSPKNFSALQEGELFLFKLHAPRNMIVGGGIYAHTTTLPCSLAWEVFRESNGAHSALEMRERIVKYRTADQTNQSDFAIGCRILTQPFFFAETDWIAPVNWSPNIVSFKTYNTDNADGLQLWEAICDRLSRQSENEVAEAAKRYGKPQRIQPRLGQPGFRVLVRDIYGRRCAVTRERTLPALEAAHIRPYDKGGEHKAQNGLLLRRDIHSLFDAGYVTVTPDLRFEVSRRIKAEFENGRDYYALQGRRIVMPQQLIERPDPSALVWHNDHCFRG